MQLQDHKETTFDVFGVDANGISMAISMLRERVIDEKDFLVTEPYSTLIPNEWHTDEIDGSFHLNT